MSFDSPESDKTFQITDDKKKDGKKKDGKKEKKEKGYMVFEEEESDGGLNDMKSPNKGKRGKPGFKFPASKNIFPKGGKEEKKDKESKKEEKEKKKPKSKDKKKTKRVTVVRTIELLDDEVQPIFGVPLVDAVERNKSHDGIELPAIFRECIDYIEEYGLECEGIYRISGVKSKVQHLKDCYNKGYPAHLEEHEPNIVASLLKLFLRDLPEPVLTSALMNRFEEASTIRNEAKLVEQFSKLISELPVCNRLLLSWMIVHMTHIIQYQKTNKMTLQNVSIVLSPTMQISHRVLNILFSKSSQLFHDTQIKKYVPPLKPATSRWSLELPEDTIALEEELAKQESLLNQLHSEVKGGKADADKEEQLWEVQRVVTHLKRKIKFARKTLEAAEKRKKEVELKLQATAAKEQTESQKVAEKPKSEAEGPEQDEVDAVVTTEESVTQVDETSEGEAEAEREIDPDQEIDYKHNRPEDEDEIDYKHNREDADEEDEESDMEEPTLNAQEKEQPQEPASKISDSKSAEEETRKTVTFDTDRPVSSKKKPAPNPPLNTQQSMHEPLKPIKALPIVPKKIEDNSDEDRKKKRREELKALEIELLGLKQEEEEKQNMQNQGSENNQEAGDEIDEEYQQLIQEEYALKLEQEEMMIISDELRQKIKTEEKEIERLHQEIQELQYLRHDSDLEDVSSSSDSSYDSDDDEDLEEILHQLIVENEELEKKNSEFCQKIHEERMICLSVKLQIRLLQQKQLGHSQSMEKEMLI